MVKKKRVVKKVSKVKNSKVKSVKKVPKRKISKKKVSKNTPKKVNRKINLSKNVYVNKNKINLILSRLIFFVGLSLASFVLSFFLSNEMFKNLFLMLTIVFGFISAGLLIVFLIFLILKFLRK